MNQTGIGTRQDRTPGRFRIEASPFRTVQSLIDALSATTGHEWRYIEPRDNHIGGLGDTPAARDGDESKLLYKDARGGWWIARSNPRMMIGMPDMEATFALAQTAEPEAEPESCGNYYRDEVDYMRHPD